MLGGGGLLLAVAIGTAFGPPGNALHDVVGPGALVEILIMFVGVMACIVGSPRSLTVAAVVGIGLLTLGVILDIEAGALRGELSSEGSVLYLLLPGLIVLGGAAVMEANRRIRPIEH